MTLTRYGIKEWGFWGIVALVLLTLCVFAGLKGYVVSAVAVGIIVLVIYGALAAFFRSPRRQIVQDERLICSPADGVVRDIEIIEDFTQAPFEGKALRIGIFLSVFNVHVNRAPAKWNIISKQYRKGRYLDARNSRCAKENEAMTLAGFGSSSDHTFPMGVRQISGAIARRIVCPVEPGTQMAKGHIYGMIKFGSRTELYLPADGSFEVKVKIGDKVFSGETVMAELKK